MQGPVRPVDPARVRKTAEDYYRSGQFYCSEAIVRTINDAFRLNYPDTIVWLASGFPISTGGAIRSPAPAPTLSGSPGTGLYRPC